MYQRFQVVITFLNVSNLFTTKLFTFHNLKARCQIYHSLKVARNCMFELFVYQSYQPRLMLLDYFIKQN